MHTLEGVFYSKVQVAYVRTHPKLLLEYVDAILARTKNILAAASEAALAQQVRVPWWPEEKPKAKGDTWQNSNLICTISTIAAG